MSAFGFSAGDLVAGINLIKDLIKALEDGAGASAEYRELIAELYTLEVALQQVKRLKLEDSQRPQRIALEQAAVQCQQNIDGFLAKIEKFQPSLRAGGSSRPWKNRIRKIQWALYHKDDINQFRAEIAGHASSINMLLMTLQMNMTELKADKLQAQANRVTCLIESSIPSQDQQLSNLCAKSRANSTALDTQTSLLLRLTRTVSSLASKQQGQELQELMLRVLESNLKIYEMVLGLQQSMPVPVERQQPVLFLDAFGYLAPFHLEFITSWEAFLAVLKVKFKNAGLEKIERREFALQETHTKRQISLRRPWASIFRPGQRVDMSMIFELSDNETSCCPGCQYSCDGLNDTDVECPACGLSFRRTLSTNDRKSNQDQPSELKTTSNQSNDVSISSHWKLPSSPRKRTWEDCSDEITNFRRIRIIMPHPSLKRPRYTVPKTVRTTFPHSCDVFTEKKLRKYRPRSSRIPSHIPSRIPSHIPWLISSHMSSRIPSRIPSHIP